MVQTRRGLKFDIELGTVAELEWRINIPVAKNRIEKEKFEIACTKSSPEDF